MPLFKQSRITNRGWGKWVLLLIIQSRTTLPRAEATCVLPPVCMQRHTAGSRGFIAYTNHFVFISACLTKHVSEASRVVCRTGGGWNFIYVKILTTPSCPTYLVGVPCLVSCLLKDFWKWRILFFILFGHPPPTPFSTLFSNHPLRCFIPWSLISWAHPHAMAFHPNKHTQPPRKKSLLLPYYPIIWQTTPLPYPLGYSSPIYHHALILTQTDQ
jgi:hypothetical protein